MYVNAGAFDIAEMEQVEGLLWSYSDRLLANFAGHYHNDVESQQELYTMYVLDAIWDDEIRMRFLDISIRDGQTDFRTEIIEID